MAHTTKIQLIFVHRRENRVLLELYSVEREILSVDRTERRSHLILHTSYGSLIAQEGDSQGYKHKDVTACMAPRKDWDYLSRMRRLMRESRTGNPSWERGREMPMQGVQYLPTKLITKVVF